MPGPAGSGLPEPNLTPPASPPLPTNIRRTTPPRSSGSGSPPSIKRSSPPTHVDIPPRATQPSQYSQPHGQPQTPPPRTYLDVQGHAHLGGWAGEGEVTPGSWSTAATPGTAQGPSENWEQESPTRSRHAGHEKQRGHKPRSGSGSSMGSNDSKGSNGSGRGVLKKSKAWVSEELDPQAANQYYANGGLGLNTPGSAGTNSSEGSKKSVHFTPSVVGGTSSVGGTPPVSPFHDDPGHAASWPTDPYGAPPMPPTPPHGLDTSGMSLPPGFVPDPHQWPSSSSPITLIQPPSPPNSHRHYSPPQPPPVAPEPYQQLPQQPVQQQHIYAPSPPAAFELTPSIIAKAQKHCRFAISSLDYEDAEQARKELRAALAALGG